MNVTQDLSILHLILNASAVVQAVMLLLAGVSFMSWYYIFQKVFAVKQQRSKTEQFERDFWSGGDLNSLFNSAVSRDRTICSLKPGLRRVISRNSARKHKSARWRAA